MFLRTLFNWIHNHNFSSRPEGDVEYAEYTPAEG